MKKTKSIYVALLAVLLSPFAANADMIIEYSEIGSDLFFEYSGSLNFTNSSQGVGLTAAAIGNQDNGNVTTGCSGDSVFYAGNGTATLWGTVAASLVTADSSTFWADGVCYDDSGNTATGDGFMFRYNTSGSVIIWSLLPYEAGQTISGTLLMAGYSISSSGISDWSVNLGERGSISFRAAGATSVPEPGTLALLGLGLVGMAARRKKKV